ncbi:MAG: DUF4337 family protein [Methylocystis sp.]|nr:DUF4337 family protein [Methylocystis sp.]
MSDSSPSEHFEHAEHAEEAAREGAPFLLVVSVTIAILAVAAATVGSLEAIETAATLGEQNAASLLQNKTSDKWAFFQAKSIKKNAYDIAAKQGGAAAADFAREARRNEEESRTIRAEAEELEKQVAEKLHEAERRERRHHILTTGVTLLHVAIAITTIAIIMKGRRWPWITGLALAAGGLVMTGYAYL